MAERRDDLLALDADALVTLANRGLVKRATKLVERGDGPSLELRDDGELLAVAGDVTTRIPPGVALAEAPCSCGSGKVCRHRVAAVLAYQASVAVEHDDAHGPPLAWSPAVFDGAALEAGLGPRVLSRARALRNKGVVAEVRRVGDGQRLPEVQLSTSTVQFLVPEDLAYASCDCRAGRDCEHVALAVWAFVEADARAPELSVVVVELGRAQGVDPTPADAALELVAAVLRDGVAHADDGLLARFPIAARPMEQAGFQWPLDVLQCLEASLRRYRTRSAIFEEGTSAALIAELYARIRAVGKGGAHPDRAILGQDVGPEVRLDHLRLIALGARVSGSQDQREVDVFLASPDDRVVLVFRREFTVDEATPSLASLTALPGVPLGTLARGHVVTAAARRRPNRRLHFGRSRIAQTSVTPQRGDWDALPVPILVPDFAALAQRLRDGVPRLLGPRYLADRVHVLQVAAVGEASYRGAAQTLECPVFDPNGERVIVRLEHRSVTPRALDALATSLRGPVRFVSGEIDRVGSELVLTPLAVVTDRVVVPALDTATDEDLGPADGSSPRPHTLHDALDRARVVLERGAHLGLAHAPPRWLEDVRESADALRRVGLRQTAERVASLHEALGRHAVAGAGAALRDALERWVDAMVWIELCAESG